MRLVVCRPQVPFVYGGAELMADDLVAHLRASGHDAETVSIPFVQQFLDADRRLQPNEIMETSATAMLDELVRLTEALKVLREPAAGLTA